MNRSLNLLDEALGLNERSQLSDPLSGRVVLIEDCVETSGAFVLHQLLKRSLCANTSGIVIFLAFSQPFSHYDRILRKLSCNLVMQRDAKRFFFIDMHMLESSVKISDKHGEIHQDGLVALYGKIQKLVEGSILPGDRGTNISIMVDDLSVLEVTTNGSSDHVLNFLHYCDTLASEFGCSLVLLNHEDIYPSIEKPTLKLQVEYHTDILVKAEPLATGLANDVHGQLTVLNKGKSDGQGNLMNAMCNFQFRIKENGVEYFYPGSKS